LAPSSCVAVLTDRDGITTTFIVEEILMLAFKTLLPEKFYPLMLPAVTVFLFIGEFLWIKNININQNYQKRKTSDFVCKLNEEDL